MATAKLGGFLSGHNPDDSTAKLIWNRMLAKGWHELLSGPLTISHRRECEQEAEKVHTNIALGLEELCSRKQ